MSVGADLALVFGAFAVLMLGGLWVPFAIGVTGLAYLYLVAGWGGLRGLGLAAWGSTNSFTLTAIPLFILMAEILQQSGLSARVYRGLSVLVRRLPGGLLQTNIAGCAVFAAISGSSVATAASIGTAALPQLAQRGYDYRLSAGSLAAGGTLGILIPPSIAMIIYGSFTESSVAKLFMAGVVPGLLLTLLFMLYVGIHALLRPEHAPRDTTPLTPAILFGALVDLVPFAVLIGLVLGSLYFGIATPTEVAAVGCVVAAAISWIWGRLPVAALRRALRNTVRITGALMCIVLAAYIFSYAIGFGGLANAFADWLVGLGLSKGAFLVAVFVLYTILGCLMDSIGMMVVTIPLLYPVLLQYGIDPIWFGVVLVVLIELGQITPPLGINLFVIQGISAKGRIEDVILGTIPFYFVMFLLIALLVAWPGLALWLPGQIAVL